MKCNLTIILEFWGLTRILYYIFIHQTQCNISLSTDVLSSKQTQKNTKSSPIPQKLVKYFFSFGFILKLLNTKNIFYKNNYPIKINMVIENLP